MRSRLAPLALLLAAAPLSAQTALATTLNGFAGTWLNDAARSDSFPGGRYPGGCHASGKLTLVPRDLVRQGNFPPPGAGRAGPILDPKVIAFMDEIRLFARITIDAEDSVVVISNSPKYATRWRVDGRRHQEAQMEGGLVEFEASLKGETLIVERRIPECHLGLRREFRFGVDGNSLEVQMTISSVGPKTKKRFFYSRGTGETMP
ncbi:MAG: hypothetical protein V4558_14590 [Gemmatimonadota bacterium]